MLTFASHLETAIMIAATANYNVTIVWPTLITNDSVDENDKIDF